MSMRQCPDCGEMYSTSYKSCPFCEEEAAYDKPNRKTRGGHRVASHKSPSILGPAMIVVLVLLVGLVIYFFFGSSIGRLFTKGGTTTTPTEQTTTTPDVSSGTLTISVSSAALTVGDTQMLSVTGGTEYTWQSSDAAVATVDGGVVTAVAPGTAVITASSGTATATCTVTVSAAEQPATQQPATQQPATPPANLTLETIYGTKDDISLDVGGTAPMQVSGTSSAVTWSIENTAVATVSADGTVTGVASGKTVLRATVDGATLECIIRVG